jgi:hypothetical protein
METAFFMPLLPGKREAALAFADCLSTTRRDELDKAQTTVTKESWFLQETPMGDFIIVHFHSPDGDTVSQNLKESSEPFDLWFKEQILDITGVDVSDGPGGPMPKQILAWSR